LAPGKVGTCIAIGVAATVAAKSGCDILAATDAAYRGVVKCGGPTIVQEAAACACATAIIIGAGDKKKAARAFLPRIKRMFGVDQPISDNAFIGAAELGLKHAARAETQQLLRNMKVGAKYGTSAAEQLNKKIGLTRIRETNERLADEQLYELRCVARSLARRALVPPWYNIAAHRLTITTALYFARFPFDARVTASDPACD
jgi:hypothetical protein